MYGVPEKDRFEQGGHHRIYCGDGRSGEEEGDLTSLYIHTYIIYLLRSYIFDQEKALSEKDYDVLDLIQKTITK